MKTTLGKGRRPHVVVLALGLTILCAQPQRPACAQQVSLAGDWCDQDKTHDEANEPKSGDTWTHNWCADDVVADGQHDPGEHWSEYYVPGWPDLRLPDNSCWMAAAQNCVQYMGGGNRWYTQWAYTYGLHYLLGDVKTFDEDGDERDPLTSLGYATQREEADWVLGVWLTDPVGWIASRLSSGTPVMLSLDLGSVDHGVTAFAIDTTAQTITLANSDRDVTNKPGGGWDQGDFETLEYSLEESLLGWYFKVNHWDLLNPADYVPCFRVTCIDPAGYANEWQGAGTGGDGSTSGTTTFWSTPPNWSLGHAPIPNDGVSVVFSNTGLVKVSCDAKASSLTIDGGAAVSLDDFAGHTYSLEVTGNETIRNGRFSQSVGLHSVVGDLYLGDVAGSHGQYELSGGQLSVGGTTHVGYDGTGTLTIQNGGQVSSIYANLGCESGSSGTATVEGTGSTWVNSDYLYVGFYGTGTLNIRNGGQVFSAFGDLGGYSSGTVTVDGIGATWVNANTLKIGFYGAGTLSIRNGGQVSSEYGYLGLDNGSIGTATVEGSGSKWALSGNLYIGESGTGTLSIQNGGQVSNAYGTLAGLLGGSGTATVDGGGSKWTNSEDVFVGRSGNGALRIQNGAQVVSSKNGYLGFDGPGSGTVTVDSGGSEWSSSGTLYVGYDGTGTLTIQNGGLLSSSATRLGYNSGATGTVTVNGSGSMWTNSSFVSVGYRGTGTLNILNGGLISENGGVLGSYVGDLGGASGTVTVDGSGSTWSHSGELAVGNYGTGMVSVQNGGQVSSTTGFVGRYSAAMGAVTVDGAGSKWSNSGTLYVGDSGTGILDIRNGGLLSSSETRLGCNSGAGGTVTVQGSGSTWTNSSYVSVGNSGTGTLNIQNGGQVSNTLGYLGAYSGSSGTATVDGGGSKWTNASELAVGNYGTGTLKIQNGGQVSSMSGCLGVLGGSSGTVTVDGSGSTWTNSSDVSVGDSGTGTLNVLNGGQVSCSYSYIGDSTGSSGTVTVDGSGSTWTNSAFLYVGVFGTGLLTVRNGGQVSNTNGHIGLKNGSKGTVAVEGSGSTWTNSSYVSVGTYGTGTLNIEAGGQVENTYGYLGYGSDSTGTATVDGIGSAWTNGGELYVGHEGTGTLNIRNGGLVAVGGILELWQPDSSVTVNAGTLIAGTLEGQTGTIRITDPAGGTALTVGSAASDTFSGTLRDDTGPGSLTKIGAGTQTLAGAGIVYTGTTTVLEGILKLSNTTAFASDILSGATTEFEVTTDTWTFDEALGGDGRFIKSGDGTLVIAGLQDYDPGALWDVLGGTMVLDTDAGSAGADLSISVIDAELRFACNQHLDTLTIGEDGLVVFAGANCVVLNHLVFNGLDLGATTLTPEPATLALVALGGLALLRRRRAA